MTDWLHHVVEQYGLIAVFLGCVAEGESAAILAGFFAHQSIFVPWRAFAAACVGAFTGDTLFFMAGRRFADRPFIARLRARPGFSHARQLIERHPNLYVLFNRYVYGFRILGGVAAGLSGIPVPRFLLLNAVASLIWAALFVGLGYFFGIGAEAIIGEALERHWRLILGLAIGVVAAVAAGFAAHHFARRGA
jgi:membrane protein DedA with SNARE-associated domain